MSILSWFSVSTHSLSKVTLNNVIKNIFTYITYRVINRISLYHLQPVVLLLVLCRCSPFNILKLQHPDRHTSLFFMIYPIFDMHCSPNSMYHYSWKWLGGFCENCMFLTLTQHKMCCICWSPSNPT